MTKTTKEKIAFLDALSHDLAEMVVEDEQMLDEELADSPKGRAGLRDFVRLAAQKEIARARRAHMLGRSPNAALPAPAARRYDDMPRVDLLAICAARIAEGQMAVLHRDLETISDADLRSMLEDLDRLTGSGSPDGEES